MGLLIISASLNPGSKSRLLAQAALSALQTDNIEVEFLDLRDSPLPLCDGGAAYGDPNVALVSAKISAADGVIIASPIYNYDVNAVLKNLIELTGKAAWENKTVAFLNAAGGASSYMSIMALANSLMLDFRCVIVPRFVYAVPGDFAAGAIGNPQIVERIAACAHATAELVRQRSS
ncbi:NADPH-dependent FMN reductase [Synoicihabitans lomoniglobus]|uniref:NAD(P)H-dependent oxidoreductase n=1 Tax=Synoicihabitans lomoniglobus TaxID=2909285 RepID=A0AAF0CQZ9_9BACT|nr:NAD(P)H-dependent oxidoreductase [Opitutaceae bacterium LMO-M01]WED66446.1 NAD(P)H-dependent oxidoreductase [Opitutaceae bacterium LMO-M01]